ncbi:MAG: methionine adenosyltransferase [Firmicutes bacterium]|nr:methionine adenosyltransferase [Bacillota bacterium]
MSRRFFSSESVTEGHPDKMCDQISDSILDAILTEDPAARVACETIATTGLVLVMGEISTKCYVDIPKIVREVIHKIGYDNADYGCDYKSCSVLTTIDEQSPDIAMGVDRSAEAKQGRQEEDLSIGAGDQGMMFGYACDETPEYMPMPIALAHRLSRKLAEVRKNGVIPYLRPDGKTQVTVEYDEDGRPRRVDTVVVSAQHNPDVTLALLREYIIREVIRTSIPAEMLDEKTRFLINPTGRFVIGGPQGDSGLTGRKIIVDTYGGYASHGGGSFSGKDPTKVDRSAAYQARHVAKNIVAAGLASSCEIELAYAIGVAEPVSVHIDTKGTAKIPEARLEELVRKHFDLRPAGIIKELDLRRPIYAQTAAYGHFGRNDLDLPWEKLDKVEILRKEAGLNG